jgi:cysteine desulfurase
MSVTYLDYNATTPCDPRVVGAMLPCFTEVYGNPSSADHLLGHEAQQAVDQGRAQVAKLVGAQPEEIIFTSGATEANNLAVLGTLARAPDDAELVISAIEHPAVLEAAAKWGDRLVVVPVDGRGIVDPADVRAALTARTVLVSVMTANNETGSVQPVGEIGELCADAGIAFHTDAVQAVGRLPRAGGVECASLVSLTAHKLYGPKGIGALVIRRGQVTRLRALHYGGGQERGLRPGTLNVPGVVGFGAAAALVLAEGEDDRRRERGLQVRLLDGLRRLWPTVELNGDLEVMLPQTLNVRFPDVDSYALLRLVTRQLAISTGSACSTASVEPSHVLLALGLTKQAVMQSVRLSFGRFTTETDIDAALGAIAGALERIRPLIADHAA